MNWYLIYTKPKEEDRVEKNLCEGNLSCYFPKLKRKAFLGRNRVTVTEPLFPRYVFVETDIEENYWKIKYTRGVISFVEFGHGPATIDERIIRRIKGNEKDGFVTPPRNGRMLKKNDRVTVKRGVLKDLDAVFERYMSEGERVMLLLNNVTSNIRLNIDSQYL